MNFADRSLQCFADFLGDRRQLLAELAEQVFQLFLEPLGHVAGFVFLVVIVLVVMLYQPGDQLSRSWTARDRCILVVSLSRRFSSRDPHRIVRLAYVARDSIADARGYRRSLS